MLARQAAPFSPKEGLRPTNAPPVEGDEMDEIDGQGLVHELREQYDDEVSGCGRSAAEGSGGAGGPVEDVAGGEDVFDESAGEEEEEMEELVEEVEEVDEIGEAANEDVVERRAVTVGPQGRKGVGVGGKDVFVEGDGGRYGKVRDDGRRKRTCTRTHTCAHAHACTHAHTCTRECMCVCRAACM